MESITGLRKAEKMDKQQAINSFSNREKKY